MQTYIFGAGSHLGVHVDGAAFGAEHLYRSLAYPEGSLLMQDPGIVKSQEKTDLRKNEAFIKDYNTRLYNVILKKAQKGYFPVLLGGDHSVAVASALASQKANGPLGIVWLDAHTDYNTFASTVTGNIHGLPLAAITGYHCEELRTFHDGAVIDPHHAVVVGARSVDPGEWINLKDAGVTVFTTEDIKRLGVERVLQQAFAIAGAGTNGVHVSYDLDLIDPSDAPGVSVPEKDGINEKEAIQIAIWLAAHREKMASFDLVELNPLKDQDNKTEQLAEKILKTVLEK